MSATDLDMRLGNRTLRNGRSEELQLSYWFPGQSHLGIPGEHLLEAGVGSWNRAMNRGREDRVEDLCDSLTPVEEGEGRLLQVLCCRAGNQTGNWIWWSREREGKICS